MKDVEKERHQGMEQATSIGAFQTIVSHGFRWSLTLTPPWLVPGQL